MNRPARPLGAIGIKLDPEVLLEAGRKQFLAQYPGTDAAQLTHGPLPQMLIAVDRGRGAVVNGEGVGSIADETDSVEVHFCCDGYTWLALRLTLDQINEAATAETIDLAQGIRTFGSRLDVNHRQWFDRYEAESSKL